MSKPIPEQVVVWRIGGKGGSVRSQDEYTAHSGYNLLCRTNQQYLTYVKHSHGLGGINLGYISNPAEKKVHFRLPDGREREVLTGEPVALGIGGSPSWLQYASQPVGINLKYNDKPLYEWYFYGPSGAKSEPIQTDSWIAIINERVRPEPDFLVYMDRPGADVGWTTSPEFWDAVKTLLAEGIGQVADSYLKPAQGKQPTSTT